MLLRHPPTLVPAQACLGIHFLEGRGKVGNKQTYKYPKRDPNWGYGTYKSPK